MTLAWCVACSESRGPDGPRPQGEPEPAATTATAATEPASEAQGGRSSAEQVVWEHATGQHVLDDRADLYASPDVKVRLEFVRNAIESMQGDFQRHADEPAGNPAADRLRAVLARSGYELMETPFERIHQKMWGRRLARVFAATSPLLEQVTWGPDDFLLARGFAEYAGLMPCGPRVNPTGSDWRHDQHEIAEYGRWLDAQLCEPSFRGGLILGIFVLGPIRPQLLDDFGVQPHTSSTAVGDVELTVVHPEPAQPRSMAGDVAFAWFLGRSPGLPPSRTIVQAVGSDGRVCWTWSLPESADPWLSAAEPDDPCGWRVRLSSDGQVSGGNELMLFLDRDCRPSFYFFKGD